MEYRKLIKFGNSSHVISIPNGWLKKNQLVKGDTVYLSENGNNEIILSPEKKEVTAEIKEKTISIVSKSDYDIKREILAAYITNHKRIRIVGNNLEKKEKLIRDTIHNLVAVEILDHTSDTLVLQDFLDMDNISTKKIIRRIDLLIRAMLHDSKNTNKKDLYASLMKRDEDVNRLSLLATRVFNFYVDHTERIKQEETLKSILQFQTIADHMERLADETKRIARALRVLNSSKAISKKIDIVYGLIDKVYTQIMNAYYLNDHNLAFQASKKVRDSIIPACKSLFEEAKCKESAVIIEKLKTMSNHIRIISRAVYDH